MDIVNENRRTEEETELALPALSGTNKNRFARRVTVFLVILIEPRPIATDKHRFRANDKPNKLNRSPIAARHN